MFPIRLRPAGVTIHHGPVCDMFVCDTITIAVRERNNMLDFRPSEIQVSADGTYRFSLSIRIGEKGMHVRAWKGTKNIEIVEGDDPHNNESGRYIIVPVSEIANLIATLERAKGFVKTPAIYQSFEVSPHGSSRGF